MHDAVPAARHLYTFGPYRLDPPEQRLLRDGQTVPLPPKAFDLLVILVSRAGSLVTKEQLLQEVWPGTFVEEANLSYTNYGFHAPNEAFAHAKRAAVEAPH